MPPLSLSYFILSSLSLSPFFYLPSPSLYPFYTHTKLHNSFLYTKVYIDV